MSSFVTIELLLTWVSLLITLNAASTRYIAACCCLSLVIVTIVLLQVNLRHHFCWHVGREAILAIRLHLTAHLCLLLELLVHGLIILVWRLDDLILDGAGDWARRVRRSVVLIGSSAMRARYHIVSIWLVCVAHHGRECLRPLALTGMHWVVDDHKFIHGMRIFKLRVHHHLTLRIVAGVVVGTTQLLLLLAVPLLILLLLLLLSCKLCGLLHLNSKRKYNLIFRRNSK